MTMKHGSIVPVPVEDGDEAVSLLQDWVLHKVYTEQFEDIAEGFIARCMNIERLEDRERLLGFTVDWLLKCKEFALARALLRNYPVKDFDPEVAELVGYLYLTLATQTGMTSDQDLLQRYLQSHELELGCQDSLDLFMAVAELTRNLSDIARVMKYLDSLTEDDDLPFLLRITEVTKDPDDIRRLCNRCANAKDPKKARKILFRLETLIARLPEPNLQRVVALLPTEGAQVRARLLHIKFFSN